MIIIGEGRKGWIVRAEPSAPKRTKGSFGYNVSENRLSHPLFYKVSRVPHQLKVYLEMQSPFTHH